MGDKPWWENNRPNRPGRGDININIDNNFSKSINWSTDRRHWGYNPWWNRPAHYPWYGGSWSCGWRRPPIYYPPRWPGYYTRPSAGEVIAWGLVGWGLGNLIFDCGYSRYSNPYPVQPVVVSGGTTVTYSQPMTVVAAEAVPEEGIPEEQVARTEFLMSESLENFKKGEYLVALEAVNKAIAESPGDGAFHEYRALVLFSLGQYGEAAGVLNPLLASSPGWDWSTMIQLYASPDTYTAQLRKLEEHAKVNVNSAAPRFLLGYHYMVCTYLDQAAASFAKAAELEPADRVASQLAELAAASTRSGDTDEAPAPDAAVESPEQEPSDEPEINVPEPVELEQILGSWESRSGEEGLVRLSLSEQGEFVWRFDAADGDPFEMTGDFNLAQANVLTLDASDSQMAGTVTFTEDGKMNFALAGGPPGDPGIVFEKG